MLLWLFIIALIVCIICAVSYLVSSRRAQLIRHPENQCPPSPANSKKKMDVLSFIDEMDGHDFELFCAELLERSGYQQVHVTRESGDQGVDIIAVKHGLRYAFQCKRYSSKIGNSAVQQVNTGRMLYSCSIGVVITNCYFTAGAKQAARAVGVELWDRDVLGDKIARLR